MEFKVLGPLTIRDGAQTIDVGGAKRRAVLARLILDFNRLVPASRLIDDLWWANGDEVSPATLQSHISQIRKRIGGDCFETVGNAYRLGANGATLDVELAKGEIDDADGALAAEDSNRCIELATRALSRWNGEAYEDFTDSAWAQREMQRLDDLRARGNELLVNGLLAEARVREAIDACREAVVRWPFREQAWWQLVVSLYRDDQQVEALRACSQLRDALAEFGLAPSADLRSLEVRVLGHDPALWLPLHAQSHANAHAHAHAHAQGQREATEPSSVVAHRRASNAVAKTGERRQVTALAIELCDAARLARLYDLETFGALCKRFMTTALEVVNNAQGFVASRSSDRLIAVFGFPHAREDEMARAARCALDVVAATAVITDPNGLPLETRGGLATGVVIVEPRDQPHEGESFDFIGPPLTMASALAQHATPSTVVVTEATALLLEGWVEVEPCDPVALEPGAPPTVLFRVAAAAGATRLAVSSHRGFAPLVGRDTELHELIDCFALMQQQRLRAVILQGESGVGKTRLVETLLASLAYQRDDIVMLSCDAQSTTTTLFPIATWFQQLGDEQRDLMLQTGPELLADDVVQEFLGDITNAGVTSAPHSPVQQRQRLQGLFAWLCEVWEQRSWLRPTLIVVDDVQWADGTTLEFLRYLMDREGTNVGIVMTARPEFHLASLGQQPVRCVSIGHLTLDSARELVRAVPGAHQLPNSMVRFIALRSDGVPLHVEELTRWALEDKFASADLAVPATLRDSLMARLDALPDEKQLLQRAAIVGRTIDTSLLASISGATEFEIGDAVSRLADLGILERRADDHRGQYQFRHALLQETVYESTPPEERATVHAMVARSVIARSDGQHDADVELLARHFEGAGLVAESLRYWRKVARRAEQRSALNEAVEALKRAVRLVRSGVATDDMLREEFRLLTSLAPIMHRRDGAADHEFGVMADRLVELAMHFNLPFDRAIAMSVLWGRAIAIGDSEKLQFAATSLLAAAEEAGEPLLLVMAHQYNASVALHVGDVDRALEAAQRSCDLYVPEYNVAYSAIGAFDPGITARSELALCYWHRGDSDGAWERMVSLHADIPSPLNAFMQSFVQVSIATCAWLRADADAAMDAALAAVETAETHELDFPLILARWVLGWALARHGDAEAGLDMVRAALADADRIGFRAHVRGHLIGVGILYQLGRYAEAIELLTAARERVEQTRELREASEIDRWMALCHHALGAPHAEVVALLRRSREMADAAQSRMFALRTLVTWTWIEPEEAAVVEMLRVCLASVTPSTTDYVVCEATQLLQAVQ